MNKELVVSRNLIKDKIHNIREVQVMLDKDLADLYEVETRVLNQAVKRNIERFPKEFMFQLTSLEYNSLRSQFATLGNKNLRSQFVTSSGDSLRFQTDTLEIEQVLRSQNVTLNTKRGKHRKYLPYVFTEQGVAMLSGVLKSETAVKVRYVNNCDGFLGS